MTLLEQAIAAAYQSQGKSQDAVKVHALMLKTNFIVPIKKQSAAAEAEVLYYTENQRYFVVVFDNLEYFHKWCQEDLLEIAYLEMPGYELLKELNESVYLCVNPGSSYYKEFAPDEIARLKKIIAKVAK